MKILQYVRRLIKDSITQIAPCNAFHFLRYAHVRYVVGLFTNIQKQQNMLKIGILFKKNTNEENSVFGPFLTNFPIVQCRRSFLRNSGFVTHNFIWVSSNIPRSRKSYLFNSKKIPDRQRNKRLADLRALMLEKSCPKQREIHP